jgi:nucleotide-binding universal stress UspA family protein
MFKGGLAMIKTILVPLDGSERAEYALPLAARIARHSGGTLVLIRVVNIATSYWPAVPYPSVIQAAVEGELEEAVTYLETVAASPELAELEVAITARDGVASPVILAAATDYQADLIVMCSHGRTGMAHMIMGSVTEKVARHTSIPLLIVREKGGLPEASPAEISQPLRVLVPLDGSAHAQSVFEPVAALLKALVSPAQKAVIHLVRVVEGQGQGMGASPIPLIPTSHDQAQRAQRDLSRAKYHLSRVAELIREGSIAPYISKQHIAVTWSVAFDTDIARAVVRMAEIGEDAEGTGVFGGCELIAMSTHGRGGLQRLAMGSITERVLQTTKRPLLVVRPAQMIDKQNTFLEEEEKVFGNRDK